MFNKMWLRAALVRAVKTMAQTAIATIGAAAVLSGVDWPVGVRYGAGRGAVRADQRSRSAGGKSR